MIETGRLCLEVELVDVVTEFPPSVVMVELAAIIAEATESFAVPKPCLNCLTRFEKGAELVLASFLPPARLVNLAGSDNDQTPTKMAVNAKAIPKAY